MSGEPIYPLLFPKVYLAERSPGHRLSAVGSPQPEPSASGRLPRSCSLKATIQRHPSGCRRKLCQKVPKLVLVEAPRGSRGLDLPTLEQQEGPGDYWLRGQCHHGSLSFEPSPQDRIGCALVETLSFRQIKVVNEEYSAPATRATSRWHYSASPTTWGPRVSWPGRA